MSSEKNITRYLDKYAEPSALAYLNTLRESSLFDSASYRNVIVIPCFDEDQEFAQRLTRSILWQQSVLVIVVINQATYTPETEKNLALWHFFCSQKIKIKTDNLIWCEPTASSSSTFLNSAFLVIDAFTEGQQLLKEHGIGLARKIGCDTALHLKISGLCRGDWLYSTDADALLPDNYFKTNDTDLNDASAIVFSHEHVQAEANDAVFAATQLYEKAIGYYTQSLAWAGSPYAFPTIGSCIVVQMKAYAHVRGFPPRAAAEDFYILNKLAKIGVASGSVQWRQDIIIQLQARVSQRNPFGTGPAVQSIVDQSATNESYLYYAPDIFVALQGFLTAMHLQLQANTAVESLNVPQALSELYQPLKMAAFEKHLRKQRLQGDQALKAWHDWFDAFKTLKFVRLMQQHYFPALPLKDCVEKAVFL